MITCYMYKRYIIFLCGFWALIVSCKTKVKLLLYVGISHPLVNGYLHTVCQIVVLDHVINPFSIKTLADVYTPVQITSIDTNSPTL